MYKITNLPLTGLVTLFSAKHAAPEKIVGVRLVKILKGKHVRKMSKDKISTKFYRENCKPIDSDAVGGKSVINPSTANCELSINLKYSSDGS